MKKYIKYIVFFLIGFLCASYLAYIFRMPNYDIALPSQRVRDYAAIASPKLVRLDFTEKFFSPWISSESADTSVMRNFLDTLLESHYYNGQGELYSQEFYNKLIENVNFKKTLSVPEKAIIIKRADLRFLPTTKPFYDTPNHPTYGFPFDNLAYSSLSLNTPVLILHTTKDGKFHLVSSFMEQIGWVEASAIRKVGSSEIERYMSAEYKTPIKEPLFMPNGSKAFIGSLFPVWQGKAHYATKEGWEKVENYHLASYPLQFTQINIADIAEAIKTPYAWGGINGEGRDCSQTLQDLYSPFGVHIPRNSKAQSEAFVSIDVSRLSPEEKQQAIIDYGEAFATILYLKGHVMLYVGVDEHNTPLVYHNIWGYKDYTMFLQETRNVIGKTVISDLLLGEQAFLGKSLLERVEKMLFIRKPNKN